MSKSLLILTGHSKGLGRAILDVYLKRGDFDIIAISRSKLGLREAGLKEVSLDLSDLETLEKQLPELFPSGDFKEVFLINNAGWIGEVKPVGHLSPNKLNSQINLNLLAPMYLCNAFIKAYQNQASIRVICNISSGASSRPVAGWAGYCSTKAGLAMFSQVASKDNSESGIRIFSLAPGIVDTDMQAEIREADQSDFPNLEKFREYKSQGKLSSPEHVAKKICYLLSHPEKFEGVEQDVREFGLT